MNSLQINRAKLLTALPPMTENAVWRQVDPRDRHRIDCDHVRICGQQATWATQQSNLYVCDYHRFLYEVQRAVQTLVVRNLDDASAAESRELALV